MELFLIFSHSNIGRQSQNSVPQTRLKSLSHSPPLSPVSVTARVDLVPHINRNQRSPGKCKGYSLCQISRVFHVPSSARVATQSFQSPSRLHVRYRGNGFLTSWHTSGWRNWRTDQPSHQNLGRGQIYLILGTEYVQNYYSSNTSYRKCKYICILLVSRLLNK